MKGTYILFIHLDSDKKIQIGKKGTIDFKSGWYIYVGSALHSMIPRIKRHLRTDKNHHWHIDYLLTNADIKEVYVKQGTDRQECMVSDYFSKKFESIKGFGCSDCSCYSHLYTGRRENLESLIQTLHFIRFQL